MAVNDTHLNWKVGAHKATLNLQRPFTAAQHKHRQHLQSSISWHMFIIKQNKICASIDPIRGQNVTSSRASPPLMNPYSLLKHFLRSRGQRWGHILSFLIRPEGLAPTLQMWSLTRSAFSWKEIPTASSFLSFFPPQFLRVLEEVKWFFVLLGLMRLHQVTKIHCVHLNPVIKLPCASGSHCSSVSEGNLPL